MHRNIAWLAACLLLSADAAWAHPGHGVTDPAGPAHYVLEPLHAVPVLIIVAGMVGVWRAARLLRRAAVRSDGSRDD